MIDHGTNCGEINVIDNKDSVLTKQPSGIEGVNDRVIKCVPAINKYQIILCGIVCIKFGQGVLTSFFNEFPVMKASLYKVPYSYSVPLRVLKWIDDRVDCSLPSINGIADVEGGHSISAADL